MVTEYGDRFFRVAQQRKRDREGRFGRALLDIMLDIKIAAQHRLHNLQVDENQSNSTNQHRL